MTDVTTILAALQAGDSQAADKLLPLVYDELRKLAAQKMAHEAPGDTLQPTALLHEAYLRLVGDDHEKQWDHRGHFFAAAAEAMRRILIENARRRRTQKRGGDFRRHDIDDLPAQTPEADDKLLAVDEALTKFAAQDPLKAELVKLRYFGGFTMEQAADLLNISRATAERYWAYARAWLHQEILREIA
jgi:RNA polymerase sigma factor (TIGR02999 family)